MPQQFGGSRLDYGDFAFRMEGYAAVLSRDGQGGALFREVAKLKKFEDNTIETLGRTFWDVQQLSAAMAAALITRTRGEAATLVRRILSVRPGDGLQAWFAVTHWFKPRSVVEQAALMARLISPKRTKNVNELQVAVMQWELTLVEHESKFSEVVPDSVKTAAMRAMLPKDVLERFLDGPFQYEELRNRVSAYVGEKLAGQDANGGAQPMDIGQIDKSEGEDEDVNAVQQRRPHDRSNQKHKQESDNERKHFNRWTANSSPSAPRQSTPRDKKPGSDETKQSGVRRSVSSATGVVERVILPGSAHQGDDCQDVDEVGTDPSSDADSDLFGLDWGDDAIATMNSVTERNDRTRGGKELLAFVDSGAVDNVLPKSVCTEYTPGGDFQVAERSWFLKEQTDHTSSTMDSDGFESRQALEAI